MPKKMNEKIAKTARDELAMLNGTPPHDHESNICYGDGYFANSLIRKYGMSIEELEKASGYRKRYEKYQKEKKKLDKIMK